MQPAEDSPRQKKQKKKHGGGAVRFQLSRLSLVYICVYGREELNSSSIPARSGAVSRANPVSELHSCGRDAQAPLRRKEEDRSSMPHKTLLLLISFSISQLDLAMTESNISLRRLVMVLMYKESTSKKMDQCYFPSCYHVHYCFNYQRSDNGYPLPISVAPYPRVGFGALVAAPEETLFVMRSMV